MLKKLILNQPLLILIAYVGIMLALPLISVGATQDLHGLWTLGTIFLIVAAAIPPLQRLLAPWAKKQA